MANPAFQKPLLVIEDDTFLAKAYKLRFEKQGLRTDIAANGNEALSMLEGPPPGAVILDILLPGKNGFELLEAMRSREGWMDIPIIVVSNLSKDADLKRSFGLGATDYVVKADVELSDVVRIVLRHLMHLH